MGLCAGAYNNIKLVALKDSKRDDINYSIYLFNNKGGCQNVKFEGFYSGDKLYSTGNIPYSSYGGVRRELCKFVIGLSIEEVWADPKAEYPFIEMINFSDCEGGFDNDICIELSKDFEEWRERIELEFKEDYYFLEFYNNWAELFKAASANNGVVSYH